MEVVPSIAADQGVVTSSAEELVVSVLTVECVVSAVSFDDVVAGTGIDVFDGDESVNAIASVLPAGGVEIDAVVSARELSGIAS